MQIVLTISWLVGLVDPSLRQYLTTHQDSRVDHLLIQLGLRCSGVKAYRCDARGKFKGRGNHLEGNAERCSELYPQVAVFAKSHLSIAMPNHVFLSSLLISYRRSRCLCSLARLANVIDFVEPFVKTAPGTLLVDFVWLVSRLDFTSRWAFES